jgi:hypothetical protein
MGSWSLHVEGHGIHDNGREDDADSRLVEFVRQLQRDGHVVTHASMTIGAGRSITPDYEPHAQAEPEDFQPF